MTKPSLSKGSGLPCALAALGLLSAFGLVLYWPIVSGQYTLHGDFASLTYPWANYVAHNFQEGRLPLWDNLRAAGYPFLISSQAQVFYPASLFLPLLLEGGKVSYQGLEIIVLLHFLAAGFFAYLLGRRLGLSFAAALITGLSFMSCGFFLANSNHKATVETVAWLPLVFYAVDRLIHKPGPASLAIAGPAGAMMILAGWTPAVYIAAPFVLAYAVWGLLARSTPLNLRLRIIGALLLAALLAAGLSAVQTLPAWEMTGLSSRQEPNFAWSAAGSLWPGYLLSALVPLVHWGGAGYSMDELHFFTGLVPLMLAGYALAAGGKAGRFFWLAAALAAVAVALGPHTPLFHWLWKNLWGMKMFRCPGRYMIIFQLAVAVLAGLGAARLLDRSRPRGKGVWLLLAAYGLLGLAGLALRLKLTYGPPGLSKSWGLAPDLAAQLSQALLIWFAALGLMAAARWRSMPPWLTGAGLAALLAAQAIAFPAAMSWSEKKPADYFPVTANVRYLRKHIPPGRVGIDLKLTFQGHDDTNASLVFNLPSASIYDTLDEMRHHTMALTGQPQLYADLTDERFLSSYRPAGKLAQGKYLNKEWQLRHGSRESISLADILKEPIKEFGVVSHLAFSEKARQGEVVAEVVLEHQGRETARLPLRAGVETAEWSIDNPDKQAEFSHQRAKVALSWRVAGNKFQGHSFLAQWTFTEPIQADRIILRGATPKGVKTVIREIEINGRGLSQYGQRYVEVRPHLFRNRYALERFRILHDWRVSRPGLSALETTRMADLTRQCVLEKNPAFSAPGQQQTRPDSDRVELVSEEPNHLELKVWAASRGILFAADTFYPGWRVKLNGRPAEIMRCDYLFRGVALEPGTYRVEFSFEPDSFRIGARISLASLAALALLLGLAAFLGWRRRGDRNLLS
jgi:hypothetical protein